MSRASLIHRIEEGIRELDRGEKMSVDEAMTIIGTGYAAGAEFPLAVRQISGAIARRIVCPVEPGRKLVKGEIYGMIKFGSRTELYLPVGEFDVKVKVGDKVTPDTVVGIIEAMKVMNEIKAEKSGVIKEIVVENGQPVEYGEALFVIG